MERGGGFAGSEEASVSGWQSRQMNHTKLMGSCVLRHCWNAGLALLVSGSMSALAQSPATDPGAAVLAKEVAGLGWILFSAKTAQGDYDLFLCRPDGSAQRNFTQTPDANEFGGRFSPDSKWMLYRRQHRNATQTSGKEVNHDLWGTQGALVIAKADGSDPQAQGEEGAYPWASWSPDGKQIACLYKREGQIRIFDLATKKLVKELPRQGIFQQLFWSPDGKHLCGTANLNGQDWNIVSIDLSTGKEELLSRVLNCTADWFQGDPNRVIYSNRTPGLGSGYGFTMLMQATADGKSRTLVFGERGRHLYYGCTSPDDKYVIFSRPESDGGTDAKMALVRLVDTPIIVPDDYTALRSLYPNAKRGPVLQLQVAGFEPHWTYAEIGEK
jgi:Tol biopolymer transport system component